ncbi:hypothetical protein AN214_00263 [Pseudoalteromonas sp. P1-9]|uniref:DUF1826 domain-containing protein n=1 Tax=Pseudoalteromonas sp. P1-9 TaxID=1710354 RepID=UPI0006D60CC6|nr:DUF1826 domain-containing protein [Pseudoalteromonas sp. P1-9]KPV98502.1 hypothetical protein AN214_00263 [Pseudoalteromonas sp. P1-9]
MSNQAILENNTALYRRAAISEQPNILADIYQDDVNIAIWQNELSELATQQTNDLRQSSEHLNMVLAATPDNVMAQLLENQALADKPALCQHIQILLDMFCTLFELQRAGLRLTLLDKAMCPKFHVDKIPCRLVSTLGGPATEWLAFEDVDYTKLGLASVGLSDDESGVYLHENAIQQMQSGDVALLKGSGWQNNQDAALVHRSPQVINNEKRLVITLDFID